MAAIPRVQAPLVDRAGLPTREWYTYLLQLANSAGMTPEQAAQLGALAEAVKELQEQNGSFQFIGSGSISIFGTPAAGTVQITLENDSDAPGNTWFYGTGPDGTRGWYAIGDTIEVVPGELTKDVDAGTGVVTLGLAEVPDSGTGTLQLTAFDSKGRKTGTAAATTDDLAEGATNLYFTDERADARIELQKAQPNGLATLDSGGKLEANQLPALAITETFVVSSQAAMLALSAQQGDVAVRTDQGKSYILTAEPAATLSNWQELLVPTGNPGTVTSVAISVPTGLSVAGSPITTSGTFTVTYTSGYQGYTTAEASKLSGIASGATVGATWGTNLAGIPANITSWAGIAPAAKADDSAVVHITGTEEISGQKRFTASTVYFGSASGGTVTVYDRPGTSAAGSSIQFTSPASFPGVVGFIGTGYRTDLRFGEGVFRIGASSTSSAPSVFLDISSSYFRPSNDNVVPFGGASNRISVYWAGSGTISTSDAREKTAVTPLAPNELACSLSLGREIGWFQFLDAVAAKGAGEARQHVGMTVQRAIEIMEAHNINALRWGFICFDEWSELQEVRGDDGEVAQEYRAAGNRYSFRENELHAFILRGYIQKQDELETRILALESVNSDGSTA